jgi:hypothetical protein
MWLESASGGLPGGVRAQGRVVRVDERVRRRRDDHAVPGVALLLRWLAGWKAAEERQPGLRLPLEAEPRPCSEATKDLLSVCRARRALDVDSCTRTSSPLGGAATRFGDGLDPMS